MKSFDIFDRYLGRSLGTLICYENTGTYIVELMNDLDEWTAPLLFAGFVSRGVFTIPRDIALAWVRERLIPPERQNISAILANHHLKEYDEIRLLEISHGECAQDDLVLKKCASLPDYVRERMGRNLTEFVVCDDHVLTIFADDMIRNIDRDTVARLAGYEKLWSKSELLESARIGAGGYFVTFNDSMDITATSLYSSGVSVPLKPSDLACLVRKSVVDTTEVCDLLGCSRQNISYLVKKELLTPLRSDVKGSLYLKGEVQKCTW
ncbi:MAG: hypothetical protein ILP10_05855 [Lachnospiraceae bacterium]|nr:hypothetical protein [Lachnospiraceae bacterium]